MKKPIFESTEKYISEYEYGLTGKIYDLIMDNGCEYVINFFSKEVLMWSDKNGFFRKQEYKCLKADDQTYFVVVQMRGEPLRTCCTIILDLKSSLVTMHIARQGGIVSRPRMVQVEIIFGAIMNADKALPIKRHSFSADLVGKKINWTYSSGFVNTHIYISENYCRARAIHRPSLSDELTQEQKKKIMNDLEIEKIWFYEEPYKCVKIKDGMYLCSFVEENMNKRDNSIGGNNLLTLSNMKDGFDVGRTFCLDMQQQPESGLFIAHGAFTNEDTELEHLESPYRI